MVDIYNITHTALLIMGLYTDDYKKSLHVREVARRVAVDVKSVQIQLQRLEELNILSSVRRGRNREFSLNLDVATRHYLVMAECLAGAACLRKHFLIKKMLKMMDRHVGGIVLLFGSYADGTATRVSDVDLFVIGCSVDKKVVRKVSDAINRDINVKTTDMQKFLDGLGRGDPLMLEVVSKHIVLKGADEFCGILWRRYAG